MMKTEIRQVGELATNCYIVWDENTRNCAVIDPGDEGAYLWDEIKRLGLSLKLILLTHGHFDHIGGVQELLEVSGQKPAVYLSECDLGLKPVFGEPVVLDRSMITPWQEGDTVTLDSITFTVMSTPGHTPGSVCLITEDSIFSGDTLFRDSCGRTDFPGGSWKDMCASLRRLYELKGDYKVYSGHTPPTTLARERAMNAFMQSALS